MFCDCNGHLVWAEIAWRELALAAPAIPCGTAIRSSAESSADAIIVRQIFTEHTRKDRRMTAPLSAAKAIADTLTQSGFDVLSPAWEDAVNLKVTNARSVLCELTINPNGEITWDYRTFDGGRTSAEHLTSIVLDLLSPAWDETTALRFPRQPDLTLKGVIGRALVDRGMCVTLGLSYQDQQFFEAHAEITVTNPAEPSRGSACVSDHGAICWKCRAHQSVTSSVGLNTDEIAKTIARTLARTQLASCPI